MSERTQSSSFNSLDFTLCLRASALTYNFLGVLSGLLAPLIVGYNQHWCIFLPPTILILWFVNRYIVDHVNFKDPLIDCFTGADITTDDYRWLASSVRKLASFGIFCSGNYIEPFRVPFGIADLLFIGLIIFIFFLLEVCIFHIQDITAKYELLYIKM